MPVALADRPPQTLAPFHGPADTIREMIKACLGPRGEQSAVVHSVKNSIVRELEPKDYFSEILAVRFFVAERVRYSNDALAVEQVQDPEHLCDQIIQYGKAVGDCFPRYTLVVRHPNHLARIDEIQPGDRIWGLDGWSTVEAVADKGVLSIDSIDLEDGLPICLTEDHHVFVVTDGIERRIRVRELEPGMVLTRPASSENAPVRHRRVAEPRVKAISRQVRTEHCVDIQTSDHRVYLPTHDVTVSQCDDIATLTAALCRQLGREAHFVTVGFGAPGNYTHVFARVKEPRSGRWIICDPVAGPNEASMLARVKTYKIWEM